MSVACHFLLLSQQWTEKKAQQQPITFSFLDADILDSLISHIFRFEFDEDKLMLLKSIAFTQ